VVASSPLVEDPAEAEAAAEAAAEPAPSPTDSPPVLKDVVEAVSPSSLEEDPAVEAAVADLQLSPVAASLVEAAARYSPRLLVMVLVCEAFLVGKHRNLPEEVDLVLHRHTAALAAVPSRSPASAALAAVVPVVAVAATRNRPHLPAWTRKLLVTATPPWPWWPASCTVASRVCPVQAPATAMGSCWADAPWHRPR